MELFSILYIYIYIYINRPEQARTEPNSTGYCIFNNIGIGAAYAKYKYKDSISRIAIIDIDIHQGNGTEMLIRNLKPTHCGDNQWNFKPWYILIYSSKLIHII